LWILKRTLAIRGGSPIQLFLTAFESVPDPRAENVRHDLVEIIFIAFLAVLCGAQRCSEMAKFGFLCCRMHVIALRKQLCSIA
jgi:DDE_Tnp_1-associated